jgi:ABC-type ATPase involved in cell division
MVIATHDLNLLNQLGGKRLVLKDGEIDEHTLPEFKR